MTDQLNEILYLSGQKHIGENEDSASLEGWEQNGNYFLNPEHPNWKIELKGDDEVLVWEAGRKEPHSVSSFEEAVELIAKANLLSIPSFLKREGLEEDAIDGVSKVMRFEDNGKAWIVRIVPTGGKYGRDWALENDKAPLVEFYDNDQDPDKFGQYGQFVSRYYVDTILDVDEWSRGPSRGRGLNLEGSVPEWSISGPTMDRVKDWLASEVHGKSPDELERRELEIPAGITNQLTRNESYKFLKTPVMKKSALNN